MSQIETSVQSLVPISIEKKKLSYELELARDHKIQAQRPLLAEAMLIISSRKLQFKVNQAMHLWF